MVIGHVEVKVLNKLIRCSRGENMLILKAVMGKTTTGSTLDRAVFNRAQIHNMSWAFI